MVLVSGWLGPELFSYIFSARWMRGTASSYLPCLLYSATRLLRLVAMSGWLSLKKLSAIFSDCSKKGCAELYKPISKRKLPMASEK